ncbi:leader peptidase (prepilin peptidase)/N-methyltransferase [Saccharopolyspora dendranthemae]|uniref:Leader peptidase (Prepilin peptidase)/N-methyltransferase n=2 Tax=Saccharopolyspora dendranthemae TaxID=1181886 RepID=A0A561V9V4_9PSEU|nr:leader peptidase (prepilin peptidase)/N-methyltransferase [Saccharopolyspora dendranthemae]
MVVAGVLAGWAGRRLLGGLRRGAVVPAGWCEVGVSVAWGVIALRGMPWWWIAVPLLLAWGGVLLGVCDLRVHRLPDALTLPAYPVTAALLVLAAWHRPEVAVGSVAGLALFGGTYLLVRLVAPSAMGGGDVKLAGVLGAAVGAVSVPAVVGVVAAAAALTLLGALSRPAGAVAHGPAMVVPSWLVTLFWP